MDEISKLSRINGEVGGGMIKKGPWKPEEDQVLINHVKRHGPRDWSSIRSKGLLQRTGKSCRLRWVNKLRPNLKNGCKFTAEEERVVIELQAQLGNKWATIATHLPGRTDNDVKNFWSSRQKRLARILQHSHSQSPNSSSPPNKSHKSCSSSSSSTATFAAKRDHSLSLQATKISSCVKEGETSSKRQRSSISSYPETSTIPIPMKMPPLVNPSYSDPETDNHINVDPVPITKYPNSYDLQLQEFPFPSIPNLPADLPFPQETQELIDRLDASFLEPFGCSYEPALLDDGFRLLPCLGGAGESSSQMEVKEANDNPMAPDSFFDDFPPDMFDQIEPLPSPSQW